MIKEETFGKAKRFIFRNRNGVEVAVLNYGGIIQSVRVPDKKGKIGEVTLGFDTFEEYEKFHPYFGAVVGRYANRIAGGKFQLDGVEYELEVNNGGNHLHGGLVGFDKKFWEAEVEGEDLVLQYLSPHLEEGYPGELRVEVRYSLDGENSLIISYVAETDRPTVLNLTNHAYFNLAGKGDVLGHELMINADHFTPVGPDMIPIGEFREVAEGPFDFRSRKPLGEAISNDDEQIQLGGGYDHNFVLREPGVEQLAACVHEPISGRVLEVYTDEPGVQLYTGNFLEGTYNGHGGHRYGPRTGFCLETQHFPDSPNQAGFPSVVLRAGEEFRSMTVYKFRYS